MNDVAATAHSSGPRFTPVELADMLRLHRPTQEQADIIAAPVGPLLVVAGAGSGKTETMAARVVWLVANAYVSADQVLGLTFTRKAAGELAHRIRLRLGQLERRIGPDAAGEATVATYHSYAGRIVTEHGVRAGFEPTARLLTEATCWQLADSVVRRYDGDMSEVDRAPVTVTDAVLRLSAELAEHLVEPDELAAWTGRLYAEVTGRPGKMFAPVKELLAIQRARLALLPMIREYASRKRDLDALDFGDQLARAARVAIDHPQVGALERDRFRVVLLDEFQDTSHAQVQLLRALFGGGHPVTAVGDPCQAIYGWRGASAGTLDRFPEQFPDRNARPAQERQLGTSWRNRPEILRVANVLSEPLRATGSRVARLAAAPRVAERAGRHTVHVALVETVFDEADWLADRIVGAWREAAQAGAEVRPAQIPADRRPTTAVLVRVRSQIPAIEAALRARGLPVDVVDVAGLVETPEVRDIVSTLQVLGDPAAGGALIRLMTGPRWRIGPRDLVAVHNRARLVAAVNRGATSGVRSDPNAEASLIEALDDLGDPASYSAEGYRRLDAIAEELRYLRRQLDQPLPELVAEIERTLGLDVEVAVGRGDAGLARAHLDAFADVATRFAVESEGGTLSAFLAYLAAAEEQERGLAAGEVEVVEGAVQVLTAHAAKGLEWDVVALPGLCRGVFPDPSRRSDQFLGGIAVLPFPLRGDASGLPRFDLGSATDQEGVRDAAAAFADRWREHDEREDRRLAYVGVTRARRLLLCSGHWWGETQKNPRGPSAFLTEIYEACRDGAGSVDEWQQSPAQGATNPNAEQVARAEWPFDPLGASRPAMQQAAELVRTAASAHGARVTAATADAGRAPAMTDAGRAPARANGESGAIDEVALGWAQEVELLLAERASLARDPHAPIEVTLPGHLSVTQLVALRRDPQELARSLRRPVPSRPDPQARRGTAFHGWLERRFGATALLDLDDLPGAADADAAPDSELAELQARFLASVWADREPVAVEVPFAMTIAGITVRGRMDAVFAGSGGEYEVVDWKTGRRATGAAARAAGVQLAAYRMAWAQLAGVAVAKVSAAFHYIAHDETVRPVDLMDQAALEQLVAAVPEAATAADDGWPGFDSADHQEGMLW